MIRALSVPVKNDRNTQEHYEIEKTSFYLYAGPYRQLYHLVTSKVWNSPLRRSSHINIENTNPLARLLGIPITSCAHPISTRDSILSRLRTISTRNPQHKVLDVIDSVGEINLVGWVGAVEHQASGLANRPLEQSQYLCIVEAKLMYDIEDVAGKTRDIPDSITVSVNISVGIIQGKDDVVACRWSLSVEVSGEVFDLQRL